MNWWRWRERNLIIDSSHWSKFLGFFLWGGGKLARFTCLHSPRQCMQLKRRVRKRPSKPSETLRVWRRKSCHLESTRPGVCQPNQVVNPMFQGCVSKKNPILSYIYNKVYWMHPFKRRWYLRCSHASASGHRIEKGRCKSFEAYRSTNILKLLSDTLVRIVLHHSSIWHYMTGCTHLETQALEKGGWADLVFTKFWRN